MLFYNLSIIERIQVGSYKIIDHTADIAVKLSGDSMEDLFQTAVDALKQVLLNGNMVQPIEQRKIELEAVTPEELLVDFLSEINFILTVKSWVTGKVRKLNISYNNTTWKLYSEITGESLSENHHVEVEIKAVTFHNLKIEQKEGKYRTLLVFDI